MRQICRANQEFFVPAKERNDSGIQQVILFTKPFWQLFFSINIIEIKLSIPEITSKPIRVIGDPNISIP